MKKDLILSLCVILGVSGVVFGTGFLALAHLIDRAPSAPELAAGKPASGAHEKTPGKDSSSQLTETPSKSKEAEKKTASKENSLATKSEAGASTAHGEKATGDSHQKTALAPSAPPRPTSPAILADVEARFNDLLARNQYDDCREVAIKALTLPGHNHPGWQLRLARATSLSESLPLQQRHTKAIDLYSAALAKDLEPGLKEAAQHGICVSLRQLSRWEELAQASAVYLKDFKQTLHTPDVILFHALGIAAEGKSADARRELESLTGTDTPDGIRAQALWHLAQLNLKESEVKIAESVQLPDVKSQREVLPLDHASPIPVIRQQFLSQPVESQTSDSTTSPAKETKPAEKDRTLVPELQWDTINRSLERGDYAEAQRLISPYMADATDEQKALISMKYAKMMLKIASNGGMGEHRK